MKRVLPILFILLVSIASLAQTPVAPASGDGSFGNPYTIASLDNLYWIAAHYTRWQEHYIQTANIDASSTSSWFGGAGWPMIGSNAYPFEGSYNGQGFTINGITINSSVGWVGFFGVMLQANINNVHLTNVSISSTATNNGAGGLAGSAGSCNISRCSTTGTINSTRMAGGLIGVFYIYTNGSTGNLTFCNSSATVTSTGTSSGYGPVGGLVAEIYNSSENDYTSLNISDCWSSGNAQGYFYVGGFTGQCTNAKIEKCFSTGNVQSVNYGGGFIGRADDFTMIRNCYSYGNVTRTSGYNQFFAGFMAYNQQSHVSFCYSTGSVTYAGATNPTSKGFLGGSNNVIMMVANFYDTQTSGQSGSAYQLWYEGKTSAQMKTLSTYTNLGWDFVAESINGNNDIWDMDISGSVNGGYPFFDNQQTTYTWTGQEGTTWNSSDNWSGGLAGPNANKDIIIPVVANFPVVTAAATDPATCLSLTIAEGAGVTLAPNGALTVEGPLTNGGELIIQSNTDGTGSLLHDANEVSGTVQLSVSGGSIGKSVAYKYHLLSIPLKDNIAAGDAFTGTYIWGFVPNVAASEAWSSISDVAAEIDVRKGYLSFNDNSNYTYSFEGALMNGTFTSNIANTTTGNYNLIPNPYPSAIDWDAVDLTGSNLEASIWFFDSQSGNYTAYNGGDPAGGNIIPVGQAVFVKASGDNPVLQFDNSVRLHNDKAYYKQQEITGAHKLLVKATAGNLSDEAYIRFREDASNAFEGHNDASKLKGFGSAPQLYTFSTDGHALSINTLALSDEAVAIPMGFEMSEANEACLQFDLIDSFDPELEIHLEDQLTNTVINLRHQNNYCFTHQTENSADRFILHFGTFAGLVSRMEVPAIRCWVNGDQLYFDLPDEESHQATVEVIGLLGNLLSHQLIKIGSPSSIQWNQKRVFLLRISTPKHQYSQKFMIF